MSFRHTPFNTSAAILFRASGFSSGHVSIYSGVQKPDPDGEKLHSSVLPHRLPRDITAVYSDFRFLSSVPTESWPVRHWAQCTSSPWCGLIMYDWKPALSPITVGLVFAQPSIKVVKAIGCRSLRQPGSYQ